MVPLWNADVHQLLVTLGWLAALVLVWRCF